MGVYCMRSETLNLFQTKISDRSFFTLSSQAQETNVKKT